jgi:hypothetical protein
MMSASPMRKPPRQPSQAIPSTPPISFLEEISKTLYQPEKELGGNPLSRTLRNESQFVFPDGRVMNFEDIITKLPSEENKRESIAIAESPTRPAPFSPMGEVLQTRLSVERGTMTSAKRETRPSTQQQQQPKKEIQQLVERETITTPSLMKELIQQSKPLAVAVATSSAATSPEHFPTPPSRSAASVTNKRRNQQSHTEDYGFNPSSSSSLPENDQIRPSSSQSNSSMSRPTTQSLLHILQRNDHLGSENTGLRSASQEEFNIEKELKKNQRKWQLLQKLNNVSSNEMKMKEIFSDQPTFFSSEAANNNSKTMTRHLLDEANPSPRDRNPVEESSSSRQYRPLTSSETTQNKNQSAMASNAKRVIDSGTQHHYQQQNRPQSSSSSSFQALHHQQQHPPWNKQQQQPQQLKTSLTGSSNLPWPMASPNTNKGTSIDNTSSKNQQVRPHSSSSKRGGYDDDEELYSEFGL